MLLPPTDSEIDDDKAVHDAKWVIIFLSRYKEAQKIFDDLSKSSNFAACRRKPGESTGMGSLGEIIVKLETQGYLDENPYTFPDDDIDKIIQAYQYTLKSIGMEIR